MNSVVGFEGWSVGTILDDDDDDDDEFCDSSVVMISVTELVGLIVV